MPQAMGLALRCHRVPAGGVSGGWQQEHTLGRRCHTAPGPREQRLCTNHTDATPQRSLRCEEHHRKRDREPTRAEQGLGLRSRRAALARALAHEQH